LLYPPPPSASIAITATTPSYVSTDTSSCNASNALDATISCAADELSCTNTPNEELDYNTPHLLCLTSDIRFRNPALNGIFSGLSQEFTTEESSSEESPSEESPSDETAPTVSDGTLTASSPTTTEMTISWTGATDDTSENEDLLYMVYYSASASLDSVSDIETNGTAFGEYTANITSKVVTGLIANTEYTFNVIVKDEAGNKAIYDPVENSTARDTSTAPTVSDGTITPSSPTSSTVTLTWTAASDDYDAAGDLLYSVYYSTSNNLDSVANIESNGTQFGTATAGMTTTTVTGLSGSTTYYFNVIVTDSDGNSRNYTTVSQATTDGVDPTPGTSITFSNASCVGTKVNWGAATDNVTEASNLEYKLVRADTSAEIDTVIEADAISGNDLIMDWAANTTSDYAFEESDGTPFFAVLVRDEDGNSAIYTPQQTAAIANSGRVGIIPLSGSDFMMLYRDDDDSNILKSIVFDSAGNYVAGPTTVDNTNGVDNYPWVTIRGIHHSNGTVVASYVSNADTDGYFVEMNTSGTVTSGPTEFLNADTWFNDLAEVGSSDRLLIGYGYETGSQRTYAAVYDMGDNSMTGGPSQLTTGENRGTSTCTFGNGNAIIIYLEGWSNRYPYFRIYNDSFTEIKGQTSLEAGAQAYENVFSCVSLSNGNVAVLYNNFADNAYAKMVVLENDGTFALTATNISGTSVVQDISATQLTDGNIFFAYRNGSDSNKGYYKVIETDGTEVVAETKFKDEAVGQIEVAPLANGKAAVVYHLTSTDDRELQIITP